MKITAIAPTADLVDDLGTARADLVLGVLRRETNALIDEADRRLAVAPPNPRLARARERAARSVLEPSTIRFRLEVVDGVRISVATAELVGNAELEVELARDALRTFNR